MLFHTIRSSKEEEQEKKDGLYIKTLELKVPQQKAFKLFRNWKLLSFLNKLGVSKMLPKESSKKLSCVRSYLFCSDERTYPKGFCACWYGN
jgi:hypothetical protein